MAAGVSQIWSTDCIEHSSNAVSMAPLLASALLQISVAAAGEFTD
jgi:ribose-phosphate pyrophosphokinase